jgi:hypothetical protein
MCQDVLAIVENQEQVLGAEPVGYDGIPRHACLFAQAKRVSNTSRDAGRAGHMGEINHPDSILVVVLHLRSQSQCEPRFTDPARTDQRQQASPRVLLEQLGELRFSPYKTAQLRREIAAPRIRRYSRPSHFIDVQIVPL